jgi:hypothetical protein
MPMMLHLVALLVLGLMCGSELNVALFSHPVLKRQLLETHILVRSSLAALFGRVMRHAILHGRFHASQSLAATAV